MKICNKCKCSKLESDFEPRRNICKRCRNTERAERMVKDYNKNPDKYCEYKKKLRVQDPARFILIDSRSSDKKKDRENDLTKEFIVSEISKGCSYCGETKLRITLDRIDNNIGHLQSNVVPACIRCNITRRNMPYEAWLCLVPGLKKAKKLGLFKDWSGRIK